MMSVGSVGSVGSVDRRNVVYGAGRPEMSRRPEMSLPPDASNTLFVEGLTANCSRREVSRILMEESKFGLIISLHCCFSS